MVPVTYSNSNTPEQRNSIIKICMQKHYLVIIICIFILIYYFLTNQIIVVIVTFLGLIWKRLLRRCHLNYLILYKYSRTFECIIDMHLNTHHKGPNFTITILKVLLKQTQLFMCWDYLYSSLVIYTWWNHIHADCPKNAAMFELL